MTHVQSKCLTVILFSNWTSKQDLSESQQTQLLQSKRKYTLNVTLLVESEQCTCNSYQNKACTNHIYPKTRIFPNMILRMRGCPINTSKIKNILYRHFTEN
jgi:hypothetical protein